MTKKKKYQHGFIGCGTMAQIILGTLLKNRRVRPSAVVASRRNGRELKKIRSRFKVAVRKDNREVAAHSKIIWLGFKPFQAREVLQEISEALGSGSVIVSMLAGVSTGQIRKVIGKNYPVLRIMPNTPAKLGLGITATYFSKGFPAKTSGELKGLLRAMGELLELKKEKLFDGVTGLSGSGPAFVYEFARGLIAGGRGAGLSGAQAKALAIHTLLGASAMLGAMKEEPEELIKQVASKGGTTEAGLEVLKGYRLAQGARDAVTAASERAEEIRKSLET